MYCTIILGAADTNAASSKKEAEADKAAKAVTTTAKQVQSKAKDEPPNGMAEVKIDLPRPMFVGTPTSLKSSRLDPKLKRTKRPPFYAPPGVKNIALNKPVSGSDEEPVIGELEMVTDGDKAGADGSFVELGFDKQYIQIDLGKPYQIYGILVWHYHSMARVYRDVIIQIADDEDFIEQVRTVFNNDHDNSSGMGTGGEYEYVETYEGRLVPVKGETARYVRLYSNGNTANDMNHYTEVAVFGK
jgi:hypothetical protein